MSASMLGHLLDVKDIVLNQSNITSSEMCKRGLPEDLPVSES